MAFCILQAALTGAFLISQWILLALIRTDCFSLDSLRKNKLTAKFTYLVCKTIHCRDLQLFGVFADSTSPSQAGHGNQSQVRCTPTTQNRSLLLLGVLLILFHKMSYDFWIPDAHLDLQLQSAEEIYGVWGEGFSPSMGVDEGSTMLQLTPDLLDTGPKQHGLRPKPKPKAVQKRSYHRACRRAILNGCAWYNGQCMPLHEFPTTLISTVTAHMVQDSSPAAPVRSPERRRLRSPPCIQAFLWNPGGLGDTRFQELRTWLDTTDCTVVIIPETRWRFESQWEDDRWCFFHSGDPEGALNSSGVLVIVSKTLCCSDNMLWNPVIPGRLLHVRLQGLTRNVDIVACYQATATSNCVRDVRSQVFHKLDELLLSLPLRNVLLVAGDFKLQSSRCSRLLWHPSLQVAWTTLHQCCTPRQFTI